MPFEDDLHILYVNGEYRGKDSLGDLMHDFSCPNLDDMKYEELAKCKAVEDYGNSLVAEKSIEVAKECN